MNGKEKIIQLHAPLKLYLYFLNISHSVAEDFDEIFDSTQFRPVSFHRAAPSSLTNAQKMNNELKSSRLKTQD